METVEHTKPAPRRRKAAAPAVEAVAETPAKRVRRTKAQIEADNAALLAKAQQNARGKRVKIILEEGDHIPPTGAPFGHNGDVIVIVPGEPVEIPEKFMHVINDCVMSSPIVDPATKQVVGFRDRLRYPYRRLD